MVAAFYGYLKKKIMGSSDMTYFCFQKHLKLSFFIFNVHNMAYVPL